MKLSELIRGGEYLSSEIDMDTDIENICHAADSVDEESLFVIPNSNKIPTFINMRPRAILCDRYAIIESAVPCIRVDNARRAIAYAYSRLNRIEHPRMKLIAITGTNGKTSTSVFIKRGLEAAGMKVGLIGTGQIMIGDERLSDDNYSMTSPDPWILYPTLRAMEGELCDAVVMEVSSHALALERTAPLRFDYGVFTNMSMEHLDFHLDMESYYAAKRRLFSSCDTAIINIDDYYGRRLAREHNGRKITAGALWRGDVYVNNIENRGFDGVGYLYHGKNFTFKMNLCSAGVFNIYNSMLAVAVCTDMGVKPCNVKRALSDLPVISGRYEIIKDEITVIIDYAHTDAAFENILKNLMQAKRNEQKLTVVFGCGGDRDKSKRPRMAEVAEAYADTIYVTSDNSRSEEPTKIISDIVKGFKKDSFIIIEDREAAIREAIAKADRGCIVAIIGKGAERYNIDKSGYHYFNEKEIISSALRKRRSETPCG